MQKLKKLDAFAKPPLHHFGVPQHPAEQRKHFPRAEIKLPVELFDRAENDGGLQPWIVHRRRLDPVRIDQLTGLDLQPALLLRLAVQLRARIGRGQGNLDRFRLDVASKLDRLLNRLRSLARKSKDERPVDDDAQVFRVARKLPRNIQTNAFLDVDQNLIVAGFIPDEQKAQAVVFHDFERLARHIRLRIARPIQSELSEAARDFLRAGKVIGESVIVEKEFAHLREMFLRQRHFGRDVVRAAHAVAMPAQRLRPQAERALRAASPAGIE